MFEQRAKCPVCGISINSGLIPTVPNASFSCSRCRTQLELASSDPVPVLAVSACCSIILSFSLGFRGLVLIVTTVGATAVIYWFMQVLKDFLFVPKLERSRAGLKLHASKRIHSTR
jgi:uncharacterized paraquat-inducible protein A